MPASTSIDAAKLRALREGLERGEVRFRSGAVVRLETCEACNGAGERELIFAVLPCRVCDRAGNRILVRRPAGGVARFLTTDAELQRAYRMALEGPARRPQPDASAFGDEAPF